MSDQEIDAGQQEQEQGLEHETAAGLWIRVNANLKEDPDVRAFARSIFAPPVRNGANPTIPMWIAVAAAEGLLANVWGKVAEIRPDGNLEGIDDDQLEEWASYRGEAGLFAAAFRAHFVSAGVITLWMEYNGKLYEYRKKERERWQRRRAAVNQARKERYKAEHPDSRTAVQSGAKGFRTAEAPPPDVNGNGNDSLLFVKGNPPAVINRVINTEQAVADTLAGTDTAIDEPVREGKTDQQRALELTIALNKGLSDNLGPDRFMPALPYTAHALEAVMQIAEQGIHHAFAVRAIYTLAKRWKPTGLGQSIGSIAYFGRALVNPWQRELARIAASTPDRPQETVSEVDAAGIAANGQNGSGAARIGSLQRFGRRDLKGEALRVYGELKEAVREVIVPNNPDDPGAGNALRKIIKPDVLEALSPAAVAALKAIGGQAAITHPPKDDPSWKFAAAYESAANDGHSTEPKAAAV